MSILGLFLLFCTLNDAAAAPMQSVEEFEMRMYRAQTRTQRRSLLGSTRASDETRAEALANTARVVDETNAEHEAGKKSYFMGYNELSDMTDEQYRAFLTSRPDKDSPRRKQKPQVMKGSGKRGKQVTITFDLDDGSSESDDDEDIEVPAAIDWTTKSGGKYVTPIKNQGTCGSCWAFAGVAAVESRYAIENDVQASPLSVEQVLSCSSDLDHIRSKFEDKMTSSSEGCSGGMPFLTYAYLQLAKPHGLSCESAYPYVMATNETDPQCSSSLTSQVAVKWNSGASSYEVVEASEKALLRAVTSGPVTANIDATGDGFRHYAGGIYDAQDCLSDGDEVNHAVVVMGFGETDDGEKFWIIRNTWGTMWGEDGYMRIARGSSAGTHGPCNLYVYADYPVNLTVGANATSGKPTCALPTMDFAPLSLSELLGLSSNQIVMLVLCTVLSVVAGVALYHGTEFIQNRKEATGELRYQDSYARWVLPSREQIAAALAQRNTGRQQRVQR
ncbi:Cathepsin L-like proteinase [Phytophthora citrophthora]|uniref:Cathepsin L-like proteinase n=1 Tax=Phytophthora citrophthora TaxID=4793 RepID=A0AAD9LRD5_9STRA|nr:Cathepsin L-like proteinase [Phytophthora citrophthora]